MTIDARAAHRVQIVLCGQFAVELDKGRLDARALGSRKARTLLKRLAVERGHLVATDRLADSLWGDDAPRDPAANVATLVSRLRSVLGPGVIEGGRDAYGLLASGDWGLDLDDSERLVAEAEHQLQIGANGLSLTAADAALEILERGAVLVDEPTADWAEPARREQAGLRRRARAAAARAAMAAGRPGRAVAYAAQAVDDDVLDESAYRDQMWALHADGRTSEAMDAYHRLRVELRNSLGIDPSSDTQDLYLAVLNDPQAGAGTAATRTRRPSVPRPRRPRESTFVGRDAELSQLLQAWTEAVAGQRPLVLVAGEAGIGKTRLAHEIAGRAEDGGAAVLRVRCQAAERSLLLQPIVDALAPVLLAMTEADLGSIVGVHGEAIADVIPQLAPALGTSRVDDVPGELRRRRAYDAVVEVLHRLSMRRPLMVLVDDLQNAGLSTVDLLHFAAARLTGAQVCIVATVRAEEGVEVLDRLRDSALVVELGPLPTSAVRALAEAAGQSAAAASLALRTHGHTLSVVEMLRAIATGETGIPESLAEAVLARVRRAGEPLDETIRAAAILGVSVEPRLLAQLIGISEPDAVHRCEGLLAARLLVDRGPAYEFANDLVQEVVRASVPGPTAHTWHRRAADLLVSRPEAMAVHAEAIDDLPRAARGWMLAAENAASRAAGEDAERLYSRAVDIACRLDDPELLGRAHLGRARVRVVLTDFDTAWQDIETAKREADLSGDRRLQLNVIGAMGSDVLVGRGDRIETSEAMLDEGLRLAAVLGDRVATASLHGRWAVVHMNRLRFDRALAASELALIEARATGDPRALVLALDGVKATHAYLGDVERLAPVVEELTDLLRIHPDPNIVQWAALETSFLPLADGRLDEALVELDAAIDLNRRTGYLAYEPFFRAHRAWVLRLAGRMSDSLSEGETALVDARRVGQRWWFAAAAGQHAVTLLHDDQHEAAERVAREGLEAARSTTEAYELRCMAPLALATGDDDIVREADRLLHSITTPLGRAWILGADAYLCVARAHLAAGDRESAERVLRPLLLATSGTTWQAVREQALAVVAQD